MVVVGVEEVDGALSGIPLSSAYAFSADDKKKRKEKLVSGRGKTHKRNILIVYLGLSWEIEWNQWPLDHFHQNRWYCCHRSFYHQCHSSNANYEKGG